MESIDVIVVGAGAIGLASGWRLAQRGLRVTVLERDEPGAGTSRAAAGMIAPIAEAYIGEQELSELTMRSAAAYPDFVAELTDASGEDPGYVRNGTLLVARDRDEAEALEREQAMRASMGLTVSRLRPGEARSLEPALAPTLRLALDVPDDHAIDPRKLVAALAVAFERARGELVPRAEVSSLVVEDGAVRGAALADSVLYADHVVVAAGVWSDAIGGLPADARVPLRPVKGQIMRLHDPAGPGLLNRVVRMGHGYVVPRGDGRYVIGGTIEERGYDRTVTAGGAFELLRDAIELVPGVSEFVIDELMAGLRPGTPDNAPIIGAGALRGLHWATGHYRNGILLAPVTAELVVASVLGQPESGAFSPGRFTGVRA
ncbi:MAG TPA: glycine oxidase ThiO [Solirubrobacteraceae bacterium]|nr:glycine oxidase ThiO [Solirubrobacteraceae bacterium]